MDKHITVLPLTRSGGGCSCSCAQCELGGGIHCHKSSCGCDE